VTQKRQVKSKGARRAPLLLPAGQSAAFRRLLGIEDSSERTALAFSVSVFRHASASPRRKKRERRFLDFYVSF